MSQVSRYKTAIFTYMFRVCSNALNRWIQKWQDSLLLSKICIWSVSRAHPVCFTICMCYAFTEESGRPRWQLAQSLAAPVDVSKTFTAADGACGWTARPPPSASVPSLNSVFCVICHHVGLLQFISCDQAALRTLLSVHTYVHLSVCDTFSQCSCHRIIMQFSGVITIGVMCMQKGQAQRSRSQRSKQILSQFRAYPDGNSSLNSHMATKWCTKLAVT